MALQLYNSLTQTLESVVPLEPGTLRLYACGVTVYDEAHLGHLRAAYLFELLRRVCQAQGWQVTYVRNITDVDDKIIEKARATGATGEALNAACKKIADQYTKSYQDDLKRFGIPPPDREPKATEHLLQMVHLIKGLVAKGHAYVADGDVYFRVRSWPAYGRLSHQSVDALRVGARIPEGERKEDPLDFTLWKNSKPGEPAWESPWGLGRPGWHIECSAMSMTYLGESFDLHGGGRDLIFPHHENEIAQSEASTGRPFVRTWVHSGLVTVGGQKMAKSLGNVVRAEELLARHPNPDVLKLFFLMTHYSSPLDFTWEKLDEIAEAYNGFVILFEQVEQEQLAHRNSSRTSAQNEVADYVRRRLPELGKNFDEALANNLNTPEAIAALFDLKMLAYMAKNSANDISLAAQIVEDMRQRGKTLYLFTNFPAHRFSLNPEIQELIRRRNAARATKDFQESDRLRQEIQQRGFIVEDTGGGTVCRPA